MDNREFWAFDEATTTTLINFPHGVHRLLDVKDLLRFREQDIQTLGYHQIVCKSALLEPAAKEFTIMVTTIIEKKMWLGTMGKSDMVLIEKD